MGLSVTVVMSAYNSTRYLRRAIESVLNQTHRDFEFVLIDDGSTDDTLAISREYAARDSRLRIITHPNKGASPAFNAALPLIATDCIARIDGDDEMVPNRLERQLAFLAENPDIAVASSLVDYIDDASRVIGRNTSRFTTRAAVQEAVAHHWVVGFHHPAAMIRTAVMKTMGGYRVEFWPADDTELWNRIVDAGQMILVQNEALTRYRIHSNSVTVSRFRDGDAKARWVEACIVARHLGKPEPSWQEHQRDLRAKPWPGRFNEWRRSYGRAIYKSAVNHYARKNYARFMPRLAMATIMQPHYVLQRVLPQFSRSADSTSSQPLE